MGLHVRNWMTLREMGWGEHLGLAVAAILGFVAFAFLVTRAWHLAVAIAVYLGLLLLVAPVALSLYRQYDVRYLLKALQLARALKRSEIVLWYQPQVSIERGEVVAVEALARSEHPRRGVLLPGEFNAALERTQICESLQWPNELARVGEDCFGHLEVEKARARVRLGEQRADLPDKAARSEHSRRDIDAHHDRHPLALPRPGLLDSPAKDKEIKPPGDPGVLLHRKHARIHAGTGLKPRPFFPPPMRRRPPGNSRGGSRLNVRAVPSRPLRGT